MQRTSGTTQWAQVGAVVLGLTGLLTLILIAFAWPASNTEPRDLPIGIAAPQPVSAQVEQGLADVAGPDAFDVSHFDDQATAVEAIEDRDIYGAIVVGAGGPEVLTASAASPTVAQMLGQIAANLPTTDGSRVPVTDVVPLPEDDPRGAGLAAGALPLVIGGIATAAVLTLRVRRANHQLAGALGVAVVGGLAMTAILQFWLGSLAGSYWANAGVVALGIGATAVAILGLARVFGLPGLGLGAATMLLVGNPLSGLTSAPELLPTGWGTLGQMLPPGATGTALRSVAFFDGAGSATALSVLGIWLVAGTALCLLPARRRERVDVMEPAAARLTRAGN